MHNLVTYCSVCGKEINSRIITDDQYNRLVELIDNKDWYLVLGDILHYVKCLEC